jgi:hypothetical protein
MRVSRRLAGFDHHKFVVLERYRSSKTQANQHGTTAANGGVKQNKSSGTEAGDRSPEAVAKKIMAYLERAPEAEDDLNGIARWWVLEQDIRTETARVQEALEWLVKENLVAVRRGIDGRISYRLRREQNGT